MDESRELSREEIEGLAAIGLAHDFWRGQWATVEEAHIHRPPHRIRRISDGEMFVVNVKVTRIMLQELRSGFAIERIVERLTDPGELRVGHWVGTEVHYRDIADLLGPRYDEWCAAVDDKAQWIESQISADGFATVLAKYASFAALVAPHWWSGPDWPAMVDAFLDVTDEPPPGLPTGLRDRQVVRGMLLDRPDLLGAEALEWCVSKGLRQALGPPEGTNG
ncbi:hypothetical protein A5690_24745 [Mycobacterium intracellulare]|uniref:hypothetical protein n=1 Tax=Mycobacterium intracellulare TaxID=1767 RepID=UPI0007EBEEFB|nr:hypothetical protein [Mycobacterium intracellulare]OBH40532.1 hypothetical protein A5690_24745 [Mycobacterium intracellulare]